MNSKSWKWLLFLRKLFESCLLSIWFLNDDDDVEMKNNIIFEFDLKIRNDWWIWREKGEAEKRGKRKTSDIKKKLMMNERKILLFTKRKKEREKLTKRFYN